MWTHAQEYAAGPLRGAPAGTPTARHDREAAGRRPYALAADHGMQLNDEYLDFETGREADKRPGFQRLIGDAMERRFEVVLVFHTSRFARNTVEAKRYKKLLRSELGIDVISVTQPLGADADDPASFLSESVHEIFDEYYSVSLSFWTKMGLREKARQGKLTGSLPWGYVKGEDEIAIPDPEKAPYVRRLFEMYATGLHSDRTLTAWLNVNEQRTTRGRPRCRAQPEAASKSAACAGVKYGSDGTRTRDLCRDRAAL